MGPCRRWGWPGRLVNPQPVHRPAFLIHGSLCSALLSAHTPCSPRKTLVWLQPKPTSKTPQTVSPASWSAPPAPPGITSADLTSFSRKASLLRNTCVETAGSSPEEDRILFLKFYTKTSALLGQHRSSKAHSFPLNEQLKMPGARLRGCKSSPWVSSCNNTQGRCWAVLSAPLPESPEHAPKLKLRALFSLDVHTTVHVYAGAHACTLPTPTRTGVQAETAAEQLLPPCPWKSLADKVACFVLITLCLKFIPRNKTCFSRCASTRKVTKITRLIPSPLRQVPACSPLTANSHPQLPCRLCPVIADDPSAFEAECVQGRPEALQLSQI